MIYEVGLPRKTVTSNKETIEFINKNNGLKKIFRTVYNFDLMNENKPDYNSAIIDKLFFDFDGKDCWNEANSFHEFLIKENIKHYITMSGKGYHIFVLTKTYRPKHSKNCIKNAQHYFIDKLNLKCDKQVIGDNARLHRIPNTFNPKARLFCIPLTKNFFEQGDIHIKIMATSQYFIKNISIGEKLFDIERFDTEPENKFIFAPTEIDSISGSLNLDYMKECPEFIKELLFKKNVGWNDRYLIILYFKEKGYTRQEVYEILKENLTEKKFKHCITEERQLQYLFERDDLMFPEKYCKVYK